MVSLNEQKANLSGWADVDFSGKVPTSYRDAGNGSKKLVLNSDQAYTSQYWNVQSKQLTLQS